MSMPNKYYPVYDERTNEPCGYVDATNENLMHLLVYRGYAILCGSGGYTLDGIVNTEHAPINKVWVHSNTGMVAALSTGRGIELANTQYIPFYSERK